MNKPNLEEVEKDMQEVAERLGYDPAEMPKGVYMKESGQYSNEDFVAFGGYNAVRADLFGRAIAPLESNPTNLAMIRGTQTRRSEVARLQRELGSYTLQVERFKLALHEALKDMPIKVGKASRGTIASKKQQYNERVNTIMIRTRTSVSTSTRSKWNRTSTTGR